MKAKEARKIGERFLEPVRKHGREPDPIALAELMVGVAVNLARIADALEKPDC
jgi:hypothetical protein